MKRRNLSEKPILRRAIVANTHPGGRFPGIELPPTWFHGYNAPTARKIPSALPAPDDRDAIYQAVQQMGAAIRDAGLAALQAGEHPQLIGGDHALVVGSLAATTAYFGRTAVVWIDAHADFNTAQTSPTGNPHGMPLAAACGLGDERLTGLFRHFVSPRDIVLIGAREIDEAERELLREQRVWCVSVSELRARGVENLLSAIQERFGPLPVHVSFDFDSLDERFFRATGTPSGGGLTPDEAQSLLCGLAHRVSVVASDWVEFDPRHPDAPGCAALARRLHGAFGRCLDEGELGTDAASCA
jgi:arginase